MTEILVLLVLVGVVGVGLWLALVMLKRTLKWAVRIALAGVLLLVLLVGFVFWMIWWNSDDAPRKRGPTRPAATKPR
jgi:hypothetical protein